MGVEPFDSPDRLSDSLMAFRPPPSARTRPLGRLALQGGLIPPDRSRRDGVFKSAIPFALAAPLYYAGGLTSPHIPPGPWVQST